MPISPPLIGVVAVLALASGARYYLVMTIGERIVADLRSDFFRHLTTPRPSLLRRRKTGEIVSRLSADTTQIKATFGSSASIPLRNVFLFVGAIAMMVITSPSSRPMCWWRSRHRAAAVCCPAASCASARARAQDTLADATAFASESLGAVRIMQAFVAEDVTARRFAGAAEGAYEAAARNDPAPAPSLTAVAIFLAFSSVVVVLWLGAHDVIDHRMTGGELSQFVLYAVLGASALGQLSEVWGEVARRPARRGESARCWR